MDDAQLTHSPRERQQNSDAATERHTMEASANAMKQIIYALGFPETMR